MNGRSRRRPVLAASAVATASLIAIAAVLALGGGSAARTRGVPTALARVVRTDVIERQQVTGTLGYRGSFTVTDAGTAGVVTWLPAGGTIVRRGRPLFELDRTPVRLLYGGRPAYRNFTLGMSNGPDVRELQQNLLALGLTAGGTLKVDGRFDLATLAAVEQWQRSLGVEVTGTIPLGSVAFLPSAVRIGTTATTVGATVQSGALILAATATEAAVLVPLDPGSVSQLKVGDRVLVTLPDSTTVAGRVADIGRVATTPSGDAQAGGGGQGPPTASIPVTVDLLDPPTHSGLDQAPVQVAITVQEDRGVLAVPISALLAQPGGGYAIQISTGGSTRLLPVTTGLFDDVAGRVEVAGAGLAAGMRVQVPAQ
jgi:peptidoglycan hydrolase-like protein with peptidoglycan-binding domain